ncbi:hypothetical protein NPIL_42221 [Nephila pilipes]|uniref:Uncharacterized protein n=1 Tax=Nephila pilipes TaxID=299642 RepID=A0A8X6TZE9_NEPPI|nr:hypothetical protein NPIL_42221 [Nephila pilipes]
MVDVSNINVGAALPQHIGSAMVIALMAHQPDTWLDALPLELLGIWTSYKDDMMASSLELAYGIAGEFFSISLSHANVSEYL